MYKRSKSTTLSIKYTIVTMNKNWWYWLCNAISLLRSHSSLRFNGFFLYNSAMFCFLKYFYLFLFFFVYVHVSVCMIN